MVTDCSMCVWWLLLLGIRLDRMLIVVAMFVRSLQGRAFNLKCLGMLLAVGSSPLGRYALSSEGVVVRIFRRGLRNPQGEYMQILVLRAVRLIGVRVARRMLLMKSRVLMLRILVVTVATLGCALTRPDVLAMVMMWAWLPISDIMVLGVSLLAAGLNLV